MADSTITALTAAAALDGTEVLPVDQAGATKKATAQAVANLARIVPINSQTASYTLVLADAGYCVEVSNASANNLTVPPNSSVVFPIGTTILIRQMGAGLTTVVAGSGVTIRTPLTLVLKGQYATASLHKRGTDEWCLDGNIT